MKQSSQFWSQQPQSQRGVALVVALFVLAILSIIAMAVFIDAQGEVKRSGVARNSEKALKLAETGVQLARAMVEQEGVSGEVASVDGFSQGGYFLASIGSGMPGNEKWEQWHYDSGISGNNVQSEITTPLRPVWMKEAPGRNGSWSGSSFYLNNIYAIVSGGAYFPIEFDTDTEVRAVDEYTGREGVKYNNSSYDFTWVGYCEDDKCDGDKSVGETISSAAGFNNGYAVRMSPMGSYSNFSTVPGKTDPEITQQTIYLTYAGDPAGSASTSTDTTSTVRLRAINALCNDSMDTTKTNTLWEFDTGMHGVATAPAVFDPSPAQPGDEIIYFAIAATGNVNLRSKDSMVDYPYRYDHEAEGIYIFALVDTTNSDPANTGLDQCSKTGSYRLKWATPFPDPDVADWTDYPVEEVTATDGMFPPYTRVPSDITPLLPEDDVLFDYRDSFYKDSMQNQMRGNLYMVFDPHSVSPVILKPLYQFDGKNVNGATMMTDQRVDTIEGVLQDPTDPLSLTYGDPADPLIEIYLAFAAHTKYKYNDAMTTSKSWSRDYGLKKYGGAQARVIALRDRLDGTCDSMGSTAPPYDGENCVWNWDSPKSQFPIFKWSYRLPSWDPKRSDERPWNGYGEFTWETWFEQQVAPMIGVVRRDQDDVPWEMIADYNGGQRTLYSIVYPSYESLGYTDGSGYSNNLSPPTTGNGAPTSFSSSEKWDISYLQIMGIRDTWDDYMEGHQTNPMWNDAVAQGNPYFVPVKSNPVESYWTHKHDGVICAADGAMIQHTYPNTSEVVITYTDDEMNEWKGNADKIGFDRPYVWSESLWQTNIKGSSTRGLATQGWANSGLSTNNNSQDLDVEGETSAFCRDCLDGDGLIVTVFNHDMSNIEDLRMHAINATTGKHVWDYHMPATLAGDYFNGTPAIANGKVFVAYSARNGSQQGAFMRVIDADTGAQDQRVYFDHDPNSKSAFDGKTAGRADVILIPPTIANGAVYVGTYHFRGTNNPDNDSIRIYAFSPVLRIFSTGIYPMAYTNVSTIPDLAAPTGEQSFKMPRSERRLQVWITGSGSKWEEIREIRQ